MTQEAINNIDEDENDFFNQMVQIKNSNNPVTKDSQKEQVIPIEEKNIIDTKEQLKTPKEKIKSQENLQEEFNELQSRLNEAKKWGHGKNAAYLRAKKKMTEFLTELQENAILNEEDVDSALKVFSDANIDENYDDLVESKKTNTFIELKKNLDKEFNIMKKYNKDHELEAKYQSFFTFFPLLTQDEQEKVWEYIQNESPEVAIDHIVTTGSEIYYSISKGAMENGGIIPFVNKLQSRIEKLEKRNQELEKEFDITEGKIYTKPLNSRVSEKKEERNQSKDEILDDIFSTIYRQK